MSCTLLIPVWGQSSLFAQSILNGSFEQNSQICGYNLTNEAFNQAVPNATAFGSQSEIDVMNGSCGYGDAAQGTDFIALYSNKGSDSVALHLSAPLEAGLTYILEFYDKNGEGVGIGTGKVQIGLSHSPNTFGKLLYEGPLTRFEWNLRQVIFQPDQSYSYLTATVSSTEEAWVFLDGFGFACPEINLGSDTALCKVEKILLQADPLFDQIRWSNGSREYSIVANSSGLYWAEGISGGCLVRDSVLFSEIENNCDCKVFVPNAFSPNDDGINDIFLPVAGCDIDDYDLLVFNRWGELQFRSSDPGSAWDGTFGQSVAPSGAYFYWLRYRFSYDIRARIEKGEVVLIR